MSFKPEMLCDGKWYGNALRFATYDEAIANAKNLFHRWTTPTDCRAIESDDPVNYRWEGDWQSGKLAAVEPKGDVA